MILDSDVLVVSKILKVTKAKMFATLRVGDEIQLSVEVKNHGRSRNGPYAVYVKCLNANSNEVAYHTFAQLAGYLACFEFTDRRGQRIE